MRGYSKLYHWVAVPELVAAVALGIVMTGCSLPTSCDGDDGGGDDAVATIDV